MSKTDDTAMTTASDTPDYSKGSVLLRYIPKEPDYENLRYVPCRCLGIGNLNE